MFKNGGKLITVILKKINKSTIFQNDRDPAATLGLSHNVREAWDLGYTGRGVVVTILDDGLERTHPDIEPNYVSCIDFLTFYFYLLYLNCLRSFSKRDTTPKLDY